MGGSIDVTGLHLESYQDVMVALTTEKCESRKQGGFAVLFVTCIVVYFDVFITFMMLLLLGAFVMRAPPAVYCKFPVSAYPFHARRLAWLFRNKHSFGTSRSCPSHDGIAR